MFIESNGSLHRATRRLAAALHIKSEMLRTHTVSPEKSQEPAKMDSDQEKCVINAENGHNLLTKAKLEQERHLQ